MTCNVSDRATAQLCGRVQLEHSPDQEGGRGGGPPGPGPGPRHYKLPLRDGLELRLPGLREVPGTGDTGLLSCLYFVQRLDGTLYLHIPWTQLKEIQICAFTMEKEVPGMF